MTPESLRNVERLRRRSDFQRVYDEGRRVVSPYFVAFAAASDRGSLRVGFVASRRVGGAVARNRAKRLLREVFRKRRTMTPAAVDLVLIARQAIGGATLADVEAAYDRFVGRVVGRVAGREPRRPEAP